ncbi:hypothetical protein BKA62DRAFT_313874 [Auriculariales sp. MPI-PUGE-AT-0066]|nr:hypothetical protein BKA62DRAFT_313874 [Auriculariales sp. MPI-PUGE-AT-0066]
MTTQLSRAAMLEVSRPFLRSFGLFSHLPDGQLAIPALIVSDTRAAVQVVLTSTHSLAAEMRHLDASALDASCNAVCEDLAKTSQNPHFVRDFLRLITFTPPITTGGSLPITLRLVNSISGAVLDEHFCGVCETSSIASLSQDPPAYFHHSIAPEASRPPLSPVHATHAEESSAALGENLDFGGLDRYANFTRVHGNTGLRPLVLHGHTLHALKLVFEQSWESMTQNWTSEELLVGRRIVLVKARVKVLQLGELPPDAMPVSAMRVALRSLTPDEYEKHAPVRGEREGNGVVVVSCIANPMAGQTLPDGLKASSMLTETAHCMTFVDLMRLVTAIIPLDGDARASQEASVRSEVSKFQDRLVIAWDHSQLSQRVLSLRKPSPVQENPAEDGAGVRKTMLFDWKSIPIILTPIVEDLHRRVT